MKMSDSKGITVLFFGLFKAVAADLAFLVTALAGPL